MNKRYVLSYGVLDLGRPFLSDRSLVRIDTYHGTTFASGPFRECCIVAALDDDSPRVGDSNSFARYDARCSCCYLNITHSERAHEARLEAVAKDYGVPGGSN